MQDSSFFQMVPATTTFFQSTENTDKQNTRLLSSDKNYVQECIDTYMKQYISVVPHTQTIVLRPCQLENMEENIYKLVRKQISHCTKQDGYILEISENISYTPLRISVTTGNVFYTVSYSFQTLLPQEKHIYPSTIDVIFKEGIFTKFHSIRILIPASSLVNWSYNKHENCFVNDHTNQTIKQKSIICTRITSIRYDEHAYLCIGKYHCDLMGFIDKCQNNESDDCVRL